MNQQSLARKIFRVPRLAEFGSEIELVRQTGHAAEDWQLVDKELVDNALDAAEEAGSAPNISNLVGDGVIMVADQAPCVAPETVATLLDYIVRASSCTPYVSPTSGARGVPAEAALTGLAVLMRHCGP